MGKLENAQAYAGFFKENNKLLASSSGGAVTAISESIISKGGIVFGVCYSRDFYNVEYSYTTNIDDLEKFKGSKYCQARKEVFENGSYVSLYLLIKRFLLMNKMVLFIGLGCDIFSLLNFCKLNSIPTDNLFTVEILCHGPTLPYIHSQYIKHLEDLYNSKITYFSVRHKIEKWTPVYLKACFENGKTFIEEFYNTEYGIAFDYCLKESCYKCYFKKDDHPGDIVCGDYWGVAKGTKEWNEKGVSVLITLSSKGTTLIDYIDNASFYLTKINIKNALSNNPMYCSSYIKKPYANTFCKNTKKKNIFYATLKYRKYLKRKQRLDKYKFVIKSFLKKLK